jgi:hypothetical protein
MPDYQAMVVLAPNAAMENDVCALLRSRNGVRNFLRQRRPTGQMLTGLSAFSGVLSESLFRLLMTNTAC